MDTDSSAGDAKSSAASTFASALSELKRRGSMLLLVGPAQHTALSKACSRLLGDGPESRSRVFVLTDRDPADHDGVRMAGGQDPETSRVVSYVTPVRSAVAVDAGGDAGPDLGGVDPGLRVPTRTVGDSLPELLRTVEAEIEALDDGAGFEPSELRVCLDSLDVLLATHDEGAVEEFLDGLAGVVRSAGAMCHVHLPLDISADPVADIAPAFDATVEVRDGTQPQQRWHLRDADLTTDWLVL